MDRQPNDGITEGWSGIIAGTMGDRDERIEASGGWASDPRGLLDRLLDMALFYALVFGTIFLALALLTVLVHRG